MLGALLCTQSSLGCQVRPSSTPENTKSGLPAPIFSDRKDHKCAQAEGLRKPAGETLADFELPDLDGRAMRLSDFRGRVVLLNFWGTWCEPCLKELPEFSTLYRSYRYHGMSLLAVATDDDVDKVSEVVKAHRLTGHFMIDGEELAEAQGDHDFPFTYLVDPLGRIHSRWDGYEAGCLYDVETRVRALLSGA